jgi:hypothetical protein
MTVENEEKKQGNSVLKVDLRVIHDTNKNKPGFARYLSDRCKLLGESKVAIESYIAK